MTRSVVSRFGELLRALLPHHCGLCGERSERLAVCEACLIELPEVPVPCPRCAASGCAGQPCGSCVISPPAFDSTIALWRYAFPADHLVHQLKYRGRIALADVFGEALARRQPAPGADLVIPVPLHPRRLAERGFNQAAEIARAYSRSTGTPLELRIAERVRDTRPQSDLPAADRASNVHAGFRCTANLRGLRVAVIDDVMTTGATLRELARALRKSGAARIDNLIVARTIHGD